MLVPISLAAAGLIAYLVMEVPVAAPLPGGHLLLFCPLAALPLPRGQISSHWSAAILGALVVLAVDAIAVAIRPAPSQADAGAGSRARPTRLAARRCGWSAFRCGPSRSPPPRR